MVPCESLSSPMNPLQGSGVSERSRCGAVPILPWPDEPSMGIGRVGALSLWCRAHPWGSGVSDRSPANPLQGSLWCRAHPCRGR